MTRRVVGAEPGRTDVVTAVVIPIDGFTRLPVRTGVDVRLWDTGRDVARPARIVRNLSGRLVLLNEPADRELAFRVDAVGYRPVTVTFDPSGDEVGLVVALERTRSGGLDESATVVRGTVVRTGGLGSPASPVPVPGLTVSASLPPGAGTHQFPVTTDDAGDFALAVGLRTPATDASAAPVPTVLRFEKSAAPVRELVVALAQGRVHVFRRVVDLDGDDVPPFTSIDTTDSGRSTER